MSHRIVRAGAAAPIALTLSLILAGQAIGASWTPRIRLTNSGIANGSGLVVLGTSTAVTLYHDPETSRLFVRRSTNSGLNWSARVRVSRPDTGAWFSDIAGNGANVDVVWHEENFGADDAIRYRRSTNGGATFQPSIVLATIAGDNISAPGVGRNANGVVATAWRSADTMRARVSTNGGVSFGATRTLANVTGSWVHPPAVAVGNGVIYVAYFIDETRVRLRRSTDNGATWKPAVTLTNSGSLDENVHAVSLTAVGKRAYVAYVVETSSSIWIRYRRTTNRGGSWSSPMDLSPASANPSLVPVLALRSGILRAAYEQCGTPTCTTSRVMYRASSSGTSWSAPEAASHPAADWAYPAGIGYAGRIILAYTADNGGTSPYLPNSDVFVRTATP